MNRVARWSATMAWLLANSVVAQESMIPSSAPSANDTLRWQQPAPIVDTLGTPDEGPDAASGAIGDDDDRSDPLPGYWRYDRGAIGDDPADSRLDANWEASYLHWVLPGADLPTLLTSNPIGTALGVIGDPTDPSTQTLLGGPSDLGEGGQSGLRLRYGRPLNAGRLYRWELTGWGLFEETDRLQALSSGGAPVLARPFTNAASGLPDAQILSLPGFAEGSFAGAYDRRLLGIEPLAFLCLQRAACESLDFFSGYRFLHYDDALRLTEIVRPEPGGLIAPGSEIQVEDYFSADNDFHLIPLGLHRVRRRGMWRVSARGSVSLGLVHQQVEIRGRTTSSVNGVVESVEQGGFLALASNIGQRERTRFALLPELNFQLHRCLGDEKWVHVGLTLLYFNDVVRAPHQIDTTIDPSLLPPTAGTGTQPAFAFASDDELLFGLNAGFEWRY